MDGGRRMRLPEKEHASRPWRIHELTRDFRVEDVWALPVAGGRDEFPRLGRQATRAGPARGATPLFPALWTARAPIRGSIGGGGPAAGPAAPVGERPGR